MEELRRSMMMGAIDAAIDFCDDSAVAQVLCALGASICDGDTEELADAIVPYMTRKVAEYAEPLAIRARNN